MSPNEQLNEWLIQLSDLIGGDLTEHSGLDESLIWFGNLDESTLNQIWNLGRDNPAIQEFLDLGRVLMDKVAS